jgi:hypothetical protein
MLVALDTETYIKDKKTGQYIPTLDATKFALGCIITDNRKTAKFFTDKEEMYQYLIELIKTERKYGHKLYVYAHNHSYDLASYAHDHITDTEELNIIRQKPLMAILEGSGFLLDTLSFYKSDLKTIGEFIGIPKLKMPKTVKTIEELKPYLLRDTQIVMKGIQTIRDEMEKMGHKPRKMLTAGNLAMSYFKTYISNQYYNGIPFSSYLYRKGWIHQTRHHEFIRKAYRGARVECFKSGRFEGVNMLDINSLYPYVLANEITMPDLLKEEKITEPEELYDKKEIMEMIGVAEATVQFPTKNVMYLPLKYNNGIYFPPTTKARGYWTIQELAKAEKEGYEVEEIHNVVKYKPLPFNPFTKLMEELYDLRMRSDKTLGYVIKLLMNSLSGKFAQYRGKKEIKVCTREDSHIYREQGYEIESDYGRYYIMAREGKKEIPKYAHAMISILTTAKARTILYDQLKKIPFKDLLYCDTDSIAYTGDHLNKFNVGKGLGQWKTEFKDAEAEFVKEKVYTIKNKDEKEKIVFAGNTQRDITNDQLWGKATIQNKKMYSFNMGFKTGNLDKIGTFFEVNNRTNASMRKRQMKFPPYYREYSKEEMIQQVET